MYLQQRLANSTKGISEISNQLHYQDLCISYSNNATTEGIPYGMKYLRKQERIIPFYHALLAGVIFGGFAIFSQDWRILIWRTDLEWTLIHKHVCAYASLAEFKLAVLSYIHQIKFSANIHAIRYIPHFASQSLQLNAHRSKYCSTYIHVVGCSLLLKAAHIYSWY